MSTERRLYDIAELPSLLKLSLNQVNSLIRTDQLRPLRICGEVRFDSKEVELLIETYQQISHRNKDHKNEQR